MGVLLKRKYIPVDMVPELMVIAIMAFWVKVGPIFSQWSADMQRPHAFENIEYLFNEIQKRDLTRTTPEQ
ncbi:MAG: hypothetical protein ACFFAL_00820 [Promethearchaeota archaeon]